MLLAQPSFAPTFPGILIAALVGLYVAAILLYAVLAYRFRAVAWTGLTCGILHLIFLVEGTVSWYVESNYRFVRIEPIRDGSLLYVPLMLG